MTPEKIKKNIEEIRLFDRKKNDGNGVIGWVFYKNILTELSLPTIEALLSEIERLSAENEGLKKKAEAQKNA